MNAGVVGPAMFAGVPGKMLGIRYERRRTPIVPLKWRAGVVPPYPPAVDHFQGWNIGLDSNDRYGVCGPTSMDNHRRLTTFFLTGSEKRATQDEVFDLYRRSGNPQFDPHTGRGDNGVVMEEMMHAAQMGGLSGVKLLGFAALTDLSDPSVFATIHALGGCLFAVDLQVAQSEQTDAGTWDYEPSRAWGGHAIIAGSYNNASGRVDVGTWAKRVGTTGRFRSHQLREVWLPLWPELLQAKQWFDSGYDLYQFAADWLAITGHPLPFTPPSPPPSPPPPPPPAGNGTIVVDLAEQKVRLPEGWQATSPDGTRLIRLS